MSNETTPANEWGDWSPKPADTTTPHRQSVLVLEHLSDSQVEAYLRSSGLPADTSWAEAALHFAARRVTALQEAAAIREQTADAAPNLPAAAEDELESAQVVGRAAGQISQTLSTWCGIAGFVIGWGFLVTGAVGMVPGLHVLLAASALCLVLSALLMFVVAPALYAQGQKASRAALFEWAVHRPGQLERGLPGLHKRVDQTATMGGSFCLGLISMGVGGFCALMGLFMIPIALLDQQATTWQITGILLAVGAVLLLSPRLVSAWSRWTMLRNDELDEAVSWVYSSAVPDGDR